MKNMLNNALNNKYTIVIPADYFMCTTSNIEYLMKDSLPKTDVLFIDIIVNLVLRGFTFINTLGLIWDGETRFNWKIDEEFRKGDITEEKFMQFLQKRVLNFDRKDIGKYYPDDYPDANTEALLKYNETIPSIEKKAIIKHIKYLEEKSGDDVRHYFSDPNHLERFQVMVPFPYEERTKVLWERWNKQCDFSDTRTIEHINSLFKFLEGNNNTIVLTMITNSINYKHIKSQIKNSEFGKMFTPFINDKRLIIARSYKFNSTDHSYMARKVLEGLSEQEKGQIISLDLPVFPEQETCTNFSFSSEAIGEIIKMIVDNFKKGKIEIVD